MKAVGRVLVILVAVLIVVGIASVVVLRSGALDQVLARLNADRPVGVDFSQDGPHAFSEGRGFGHRGPLARSGFPMSLRGFGERRGVGFGVVGWFRLLGNLAVAGVIFMAGVVAALLIVGFGRLRRNPPTPPAAGSAPGAA